MATAIAQTTVSKKDLRQKRAQNGKSQQRVGKLLLHIILLGCGFLWVYPFLWALGSSFKSPAGFFDEGLNIFPKEFQWYNYVDAWTRATFGEYFLNTLF